MGFHAKKKNTKLYTIHATVSMLWSTY